MDMRVAKLAIFGVQQLGANTIYRQQIKRVRDE